MRNKLDKEQYWYFTFCGDSPHRDCYEAYYGTYGSARRQMCDDHGTKWAFQYASAEDAGVNRFNLKRVN